MLLGSRAQCPKRHEAQEPAEPAACGALTCVARCAWIRSWVGCVAQFAYSPTGKLSRKTSFYKMSEQDQGGTLPAHRSEPYFTRA
jgi:hypothetical protein